MRNLPESAIIAANFMAILSAKRVGISALADSPNMGERFSLLDGERTRPRGAGPFPCSEMFGLSREITQPQ